jgi:hypothetical protein
MYAFKSIVASHLSFNFLCLLLLYSISISVVESEEVMEDVKKMAGDVEKVVGSAEALLKERTAIPNQTSPSSWT